MTPENSEIKEKNATVLLSIYSNMAKMYLEIRDNKSLSKQARDVILCTIANSACLAAEEVSMFGFDVNNIQNGNTNTQL